MDIAEKIRARRRELGLTQTQLAKRADVSLPTITRVEGGHALSTSLGAMVRILNALSYDVSIELGLSTLPNVDAQTEEESIKNAISSRYYFGRL